MAFHGIPAEAFDFYMKLMADNSRAFWAEHRHEYETSVREPLMDLQALLEPEFGPGHLYRPHRDVRFSADKSPLKDHQGLFVESRHGLGWYLQLSLSGLLVAGGWYRSTPEQVARYRAAVAADEAETLRARLDAAIAHGLVVGGVRLKTRPRGVDPDHPRVDLLRHRSLVLSREWEPAAWMEDPGTVDQRVRRAWHAMTPVMDWLADAAGPAEPAPPAGERPR